MITPSKEIFKKNILALRQKEPLQNLEWIHFSFSSEANLFAAETGVPTAIYSGRLLHSSRDPVLEGIKFAKNLNLKKSDSILMYGLGLGYQIDPVLEFIGTEGRLLVLELNPHLLALSFSMRDFSEILRRDNFQILTGQNEELVVRYFSRFLDKWWTDIPDESKKVSIFFPSYNAIPEGFEKIRNAFEMLRMENRFDSELGGKSRDNCYQNSEIIENAQSVKELFGKHKGCVGLLIGSGPSLDSVLRFLKYIPSNSVVIAVDSVFSLLLESGINVDYVISIDPQPHTFTYVEQCTNSKVPIIFMPQANPHLLKKFAGEKYVVYKNSDVISKVNNSEDIEEQKGVTETGGSVSCVAIDLLIKFGANPIVLAGIDSSFPWGRYYSNEIEESKTFFDKVEKYKLLKNVHYERILLGKNIQIEGSSGQTIISHRNLYYYLRIMEQLIAGRRDIAIYQWTIQGATIYGTGNSNFFPSHSYALISKSISKVSISL